MLRRLVRMAMVYLTIVLLMTLQKPLFMLVEGAYGAEDLAQVPNVMWHGQAMDFSMGGYLSIIPMLLIIASIWTKNKAINIIAKVYFGIISLLMATIAVADAALYPYWNFRIDTTPLFYFATSPQAAMASVPWWGWIAAPLAICILTIIFYIALTVGAALVPALNNAQQIRSRRYERADTKTVPTKIISTVVCTVAMALLIIPIRGGLTVSTMNLSRSYFSNEMRLNHAAINPIFSLLYSATHQANFSSMFRYMDNADAVFAEIAPKTNTEPNALLKGKHPDIYLIILESFSSHLMPVLGGEPIAMSLDSIAREGWLFTDFYASSFRTDRGLVAILCGYPAQPTTSIMKYAEKVDNLPSISHSLKNVGYELSYYYGGDINFTNLNALLRSTGFENVVCDKDFPVNERLSKWGAHDDKVWSRMLKDISSDKSNSPKFRVLQTSSSHEPYEVPYNKNSNPRINCFMYADNCLGQFVKALKSSGRWDNSLLVIVPDHYGVYPENIEDLQASHKIPLVIAGGAIKDVTPDEDALKNPASQTDIAATLLGMLAIDHSQFIFSHDLFSNDKPKMTFFSEPSWFAMKSHDGFVAVSTDTGNIIEGNDKELEQYAKAYLQKLYDDLDKR